MNNHVVLICVCVIATVVAVLRMFHRWFQTQEMNKRNTQLVLHTQIPSYDDFEKVSKKASPVNSPKRAEGDFFEYIFDEDSLKESTIENTVMDIYGVSLNE